MTRFVSQLLTPERVILDGLDGRQLRGTLQALADPVICDMPPAFAENAIQTLVDRESLGSTATGNGVAIPHGKLDGLDDVRIAFGRSSQGIDFGAADGTPVSLFFLILAPLSAPTDHLQILARIARLVQQDSVRADLQTATDAGQVIQVIATAEQAFD